MLDGFDELPRGTKVLAATQIGALVGTAPLLIFSDANAVPVLSRIAGMSVLTLTQPEPQEVRSYLRAVAGAASTDGSRAETNRLADRLESQPDGALSRSLSAPLTISRVAAALAAGQCSVEHLDRAARSGGEDAVRSMVVGAHADHAFADEDRCGILRRRRARSWTRFLASELKAREAAEIVWWRLADAVPVSLLAGAAAASAAPAYWLALSMPVGLTRGMVIGSVFGILSGMLRGVTALARAAATVFAVVLAFNLLGDSLRDALDPKSGK